ncbi:MAG TPA: aldo/keto reductase, partial [Clostridiales bacterium]|nr:aldo/keto reductase [Clostridiales bacterium]
IALAWLIHQDFPVVPIVGCSNPAQMTALFASLERAASADMRRLIRAAELGG